MKTLDAFYFDGKSSRKIKCEIRIDDEFLIVPLFDLKLSLNDVKISSKISNVSQIITLKNGAYFMLSPEEKSVNKNFVLKLESKMIYAFISVFVLVGVVVFFLTIGSATSAKMLADVLPKHTLDRLSNEAFNELKEDKYLEPSKLDRKTKAYILQNFNTIKPKDLDLKLHFYKSDIFKANAFALPSGDIVLLDDLVKLDNDQTFRGIIGVLAHEIGHVKYKHSLRNIIQTSIAGAVAAYFLGDISSIAVAFSTGIVSMSYSRDFESEADDTAISILIAKDISLQPLINVFESLDKNLSNKELPFLSTHPMFEKRIKKLKSAL